VQVLPGVYGHYLIPNWDGSATMLMMTGWCYANIASSGTIPSHATYERFVWLHPNSPSDRANGGYCAATGYWCAARGMVVVNGRKYIKEFAPKNE